MPNWAEGNLRITGSKEELKRFKKFALTKNKYKKEKGEETDNVLDTEKFIPYPKEFKEQDELCKKFEELKEKKEKKKKLTKEENRELILMSLTPEKYEKDGFNSGGYGWCVSNWGTKWGICHSELSPKSPKFPNELFYVFDTAWTPCFPVILKMSELFPKFNFNYKYWEGGSGFRGLFVCEGGKVIKSNQYNYKGGRGG